MKVDNNHPRMKAAVQAAVTRDLRAKLKKNCSRYMEGNGVQLTPFVQGMIVAAEFTTLGEGADLIVVGINKGILIYSLREKTADQWCELVEGLSKKEQPTPKKVLIKMVALRIRKIHEKRDQFNRDRAASAMSPLPDFTSKAVLPQIVGIFEAAGLTRRRVREEIFEPLEEVFSKDGCDDEVVQAGFNLHVTQEVMEC